MVERLMVLAPVATPAAMRASLEAAGGRLLAQYGDRVWVVELPPATEASFAVDEAVQGVFAGGVPDTITVLDATGGLGIAAWNLRHSASFRATRQARRGEGRPWDDEGFEPEG